MSTLSPQSTSVLSEAHQTSAPIAVASASGPYAHPNAAQNGRVADARSIEAIRAAVGPFVPAAWRTGEPVLPSAEWMTADAATAATPPVAAPATMASVELPWIHGFLEQAAPADNAPTDNTPAATAPTEPEQFLAESAFADPDAVAPLYGVVAMTSDAVAEHADPAHAEVEFISAVVMDEDAVAEAGANEAAETESAATEASAVEASAAEAAATAELSTAEASASDEIMSEYSTSEIAADDVEAASVDVLFAEPEDTLAFIGDADGIAAQMAEPESLADSADDAVPTVVMPEASDDAEAPSTWPLDDAGALMRALAAELPATAPLFALPRHEAGRPYATPLGVPPIATTPPLPMWGEDDDMMDIMPVHRASGETSAWSAAPAPVAPHAQTIDDSTSELAAAAAQLEALARRVRQGELALTGYTSDMSDAATLAATLTALLSSRP
ncbi:MAG: hypothetical protein IT353_13230 [Gemmatimonadaceae bacterium]|nr:hypothetical protein [Gemmatimonadaceae bacterium]